MKIKNATQVKKSTEKAPVLKSGNSVYGSGHNSNTTLPGRTTELLVYHGRDSEMIPIDPLRDPNRRTRVQVLTWNSNGAPHFGEPVANGTISIPMR